MRAGIALGSNLGDRIENLRRARAEIAKLGRVVASPVYETEPVGCEPGAQSFYNAVVEIECSGSAEQLLQELRGIEERFGRPANHAHNVSRAIDLDLLYFADQRIDTPELRVPHPRLSQRRFVLAPLADIQPNLILPNQTRTIADLLANLPQAERVVPAKEQW